MPHVPLSFPCGLSSVSLCLSALFPLGFLLCASVVQNQRQENTRAQVKQELRHRGGEIHRTEKAHKEKTHQHLLARHKAAKTH